MTAPENDSLAKLKNPESWVAWPVLPMIRGPEECGLVLATVADRPVIYMQNLFALQGGLLMPQLEGCATHVYETLEAMLADGWVVD